MCWYSMLVLHCNVGENVGILNQDCLVSKRIPARTTCHIGECDFSRKIFQAEPPHATNCGMLHSYLDHLWSLLGAVLTLQDDNNGTGNDNGIERNRYHGKELVVWRSNFSLRADCVIALEKLLDRPKPKAHRMKSFGLCICW